MYNQLFDFDIAFLPLESAGGGQSGLLPVEAKIASFATLPSGWDYGVGDPIAAETRNKAIDWSRTLGSLGFSKINAMPGSSGQISVSGSVGDHYIEVVVLQNSRMSVAHDEGRQQISYEIDVSPEAALASIFKARERIWSAFTTYTNSNMTQLMIGGVGTHSPTISGPYPLSGVNVLTMQAAQSATTLSTINASHVSWATLPYSSALIPTFSQRLAS